MWKVSDKYDFRRNARQRRHINLNAYTRKRQANRITRNRKCRFKEITYRSFAREKAFRKDY